MADTYGTTGSTDASAPIYDAIRRRLQQTGQTNLQQNQEGLARKFAANGNLASGEYAKMNQQVADQTQGQTAASLDQLDLAQAQDSAKTQEAEKQRTFAAGESDKQRVATKGMFDSDLSFKKSVQDSTVHFQQIASDMAEKEFQASRYNDYINSIIGLSNANVEPGKLNYITAVLQSMGYNPGGNQGESAPQQKKRFGQGFIGSPYSDY